MFPYLQSLHNLLYLLGRQLPMPTPGLEAPLPDLVLRSLGHKCAAAERCRSDQQNAEMAGATVGKGNQLESYPNGSKWFEYA